MRQIATVQFRTLDALEEGVAIVEADDGRVKLTLSLKSDGDVEVILSQRDCDELIGALRRASLGAPPEDEAFLDDIEAVKALAPYRAFPCAKCGAMVRVHVLDTYVRCSACRTEIKSRSFGGIGTEIQDVIDAVLKWAGVDSDEVIRNHAKSAGDPTAAQQ